MSLLLQALQQAYSVLRDEHTRSQYDAQGWEGVHHVLDASLFDSRQEAGTDLAVTVSLSFHEAADGAIKALKVQRSVTCASCQVSPLTLDSQRTAYLQTRAELAEHQSLRARMQTDLAEPRPIRTVRIGQQVQPCNNSPAPRRAVVLTRLPSLRAASL